MIDQGTASPNPALRQFQGTKGTALLRLHPTPAASLSSPGSVKARSVPLMASLLSLWSLKSLACGESLALGWREFSEVKRTPNLKRTSGDNRRDRRDLRDQSDGRSMAQALV